MSTRSTVTAGIAVILMLALGTIAKAAVQYDAVLEWTGPYFRLINDPTLNQLTDSPITDIPFQAPSAVAAREHGTGGRDVVYVVDSGNNRIQAFETNATYTYTDESAFTFQVGGTSAASEWDTDSITLAEWAATADVWVLPGSEVVIVDGTVWTYLDDISGKAAADQVYTITYSDPSDAPEILFPASSLSATSEFDLRYMATDDQTAATAAFGIGDLDYGIGNGATPVLTEITEASGGPSSFEQLRSIAVIQNEQTATSDDLFVLDAADATEQLFYYTIPVAGTSVAFGESYDDGLNSPWDVAVARSGASVRATVTPADDAGPFDQATAVVVDDSQVTGHTYTITVAGANVTITDATTGRVLLSAGPFADLNDPYLGVPGLSLPLNAAIGVTSSIATAQATVGRYLFVADTGNDRIKVIGLPDVASIAGDWLAGDVHTVDVQPTTPTATGDDATIDYSESTPGTVTEDMVFWTATFPIKEGTLTSITFDPDGTPDTWTRIDEISTAGPSDKVYSVDWALGQIRFGDGIHGALPASSTAFEYTYTTTPDILRWGSSGTGSGRFSGPKGVAARWNSTIGGYDVYVADSGNNRVQKLRFFAADAATNQVARMEYVTEWNTASSGSDLLAGPTDIVVHADTNSPVDVWVAVADAGNNRIIIYDDTAASGSNDSTAPTYDAALGSQGNVLGQYAEIAGLAALQNGTDLDWFVADAQRGTVTKYEESPTPTISVTWTGLPDCFPPTGSYSIAWTTANAPDGGYIDLYYDTASTFDAATAQLAYASGSVTSTATSATWVFADTPGGTPADGTYYLYVRMHNGSDNLVASDATLSTELLCIDSSLLPTQAVTDQIDGDQTLYLQNSLSRVVDLDVSYPDSVISVGFLGSFDPALIEIVSITRGTAWDGIGATSVQFDSNIDNSAGTFLVLSSALDAPSGLTGNGPHNIAQMTVRALASAINDSIRFQSSAITISGGGTSMSDINGESPSAPTVSDMTVKIAYLGDIASSTGAGGTVPAMTPEPDGNINFQDQMAFALGWNGRTNVRDRIADIGPISGTVPDVIASPDGQWDVDDILAFTSMFSWAAAQGYTGQNGAFAGGNGSGSALSVPIAEFRPAPLGADVEGKAYAYTAVDVEAALPGSRIVVDVLASDLVNMNGALLNLGFNANELALIEVEAGDLFTDAMGQLFMERSGEGWVEISANRLDPAAPGVSGDGTLAYLTFEILAQPTETIDLQFDLRSATNEILSRGASSAGPLADRTVEFQLYANYPNPLKVQTNIVFSIAKTTDVSINVFDPSGRRVRALLNEQRDAGYHVVPFDGRTDNRGVLPAGVYFFRLEAEGQSQTRKLIIAR